MAFLIIRFAGSRTVLIDGDPRGATNDPIDLAPGRYVISLAPPLDFVPRAITVTLAETATRRRPEEITFEQVDSDQELEEEDEDDGGGSQRWP